MTSQREDSLEAEMLQMTIHLSVAEHIQIAAGIVQYGVEYASAISPKNSPENIRFLPVAGGARHWRLKYCSSEQVCSSPL
jgi:hypothetical protein